MAPEPTLARVARLSGAALLIASGVVHIEQYFAVYYRVIPIIGPLFIANFVIALLLGLVLLAPTGRIGTRLPGLAAVGGILFAVGTIVGLEISEHGTLFGFHEHGYRLAIVLSIVFEAAAVVALSAYLVGRRGAVPSVRARDVETAAALTRPSLRERDRDYRTG